jgi:hypothetical protein
VDLHWYALAIIPDLDDVALWVDGDLNHVLSLVILVVICRVYQNLIYLTNISINLIFSKLMAKTQFEVTLF